MNKKIIPMILLTLVFCCKVYSVESDRTLLLLNEKIQQAEQMSDNYEECPIMQAYFAGVKRGLQEALIIFIEETARQNASGSNG